MVTVSLPVQQASRDSSELAIALAGNPNAGKTTLFNKLTGLRGKTANFPGTTVEHRVGRLQLNGRSVSLIDLPGLYGLNAGTPDERVAGDALRGAVPGLPQPNAVLIIADATNLARNLYLVGQVRELGLPCVVALNMMDVATRRRIGIDHETLSKELGAPVVPITARTGQGIDELKQALGDVIRRDAAERLPVPESLAACSACSGCPHAARFDWAEGVHDRVSDSDHVLDERRTEQLDNLLTHPIVGVVAFVAVMAFVFYLIFAAADYPMTWIDEGMAGLQGLVGAWLPEGLISSFLVDGIIGGVGAVVVFLPQIVILFFFLALLEDTGYLARAAFVMDRLMGKVGLPGKAFVPMLSAHACAIPGIMAAKVIENRRDRLVTILILPLLSCSARLPVYAMVTALLFPRAPLQAALVFTGAYMLGILAALSMAFLFKRTILPGQSEPLMIEMPSYKLPSLRNALMVMYDRGLVFLKNAGTIILIVSIVLWALATFPQSDPPPQANELAAKAAVAEQAGDAKQAEELSARAEQLAAAHNLENSALGRMGKVVEPVFKPLGYDWKISVGVLASFAAREVVVSTLSIVYGLGEEGAEADEGDSPLLATVRGATHADGSLVFTTATCLSILVFYVLAMQCLATQAVVKRETNSWKWPLFQLGYMSLLAYVCAFITYNVASMIT